MADHQAEPVMLAVRAAFERSELSLDGLGLRMGYPKETARKSAWQFVNRTNDPRFSMLRRFAGALEIEVAELLELSR
ncbi:MAG: hypothetical protein IID46_08120 [Planctomycetes bacterium]|nr:hypothetical protein [Planctomycetota bacterium]